MKIVSYFGFRYSNLEMDFKNYLNIAALKIDLEIDSFFKIWIKEIEETSPRLLPLSKAFFDACRGGKRIRGTLVCLGYDLVGQRKTPYIFDVAVAYELFQTAILVHDDIIDKSPKRRGKPTLHKMLGGKHYGISQAICLGDIGFFLASQLVARSKFPDRQKNKALLFFSRAMYATGIGELLDVELSRMRTAGSEEDIYTIYRLKTAFYTIVAPLSLGAILAGADKKVLNAIRVYGENIGITYQIQDDINDILGTRKNLNKQPGADVREGKSTLLYLYAYKHADKEQKKVLLDIYGKENATQKDIDKIKNIFLATGAVEHVRSKAQEYIDDAKKVIPHITKNKKQSELLEEIAQFFVKKVL